MRRVAAAAAILGAIALTISAQQAPVPTGRVVADTTGDPIPMLGQHVTAAHGTRTVRADEEGRFALPASGGFRIVVTKFGYVCREVTPAPGQPIAIRLQRSVVVVSGRVVDEFASRRCRFAGVSDAGARKIAQAASPKHRPTIWASTGLPASCRA